MAKMGYSATPLHQLSAVELDIERIDESLAAANQPLDIAFSLESVRDFVATKALDMKGAFDTEPGKARQILANHIERLILTPRDAEDGPVYDVSGDIDLFGGDQRTMSLVVDACMGRSGKAKRGAKRTVASEDANMYRVDRKGVMATDPVSGHHFRTNDIDTRSGTCKRFAITFRTTLYHRNVQLCIRVSSSPLQQPARIDVCGTS